jgi:hypothetical protein
MKGKTCRCIIALFALFSLILLCFCGTRRPYEGAWKFSFQFREFNDEMTLTVENGLFSAAFASYGTDDLLLVVTGSYSESGKNLVLSGDMASVNLSGKDFSRSLPENMMSCFDGSYEWKVSGKNLVLSKNGSEVVFTRSEEEI